MRVLVADSGEHKGTCWTLSNVPTTIGRGSGCRIVLKDASVSRMHCTLRVENDTARFTDQASRNATLVNGAPRSSGVLEPGDRITVGESVFILSVTTEKVVAKPDSKGPTSTLHVLEDQVTYLGNEGVEFSQGNPQTVSDLYWLFTSTRLLSASRVREQFMVTLTNIIQERFSPDGILIQELRSPHQLTHSLHYVGNILPTNGTSAEEFLQTSVDMQGGSTCHYEDEGNVICNLVSSVPIGPTSVGAVLVQKNEESERYSNQDLEALVALCRAVGPLYQSVCAVEKMMIRHEYALRDSSRSIPLVGKSTSMESVRTALGAANRTHLPVLIQGETGTGKEIVANLLHSQSPRHSSPFITVNCAAIPNELFESEMFGHIKGAFTGADGGRPGRFEVANKGTLFLDEVATLSIGNQAKLLRVLETSKFCRVGSTEEIEVNVRIVTATNVPLEKVIVTGGFREDLYHRLCGITIAIPPLRQRKSDIGILAEHFMTESCFAMDEIPKSFTPEAIKKLEEWEWPGNVRELRMCVERAVAYSQSTTITPDEILFHVPTENAELPESLADLERHHIIRSLEEHSGNISATAKQLGISRTTLYHKLNEYGVRS